MATDYKHTLNLPRTDFPMKADLVQSEPKRLERWRQQGLYEKILAARADAPLFVLHDGPPYANGDVHIGTALYKILKDVVVRHAAMTGHRAPFVPGWDCHGLPIELKVTKEIEARKEKLSAAQTRARCRAYAEKYVGIQRVQFQRLGVTGDWENPYLTMSPEYEHAIVATFYEMRRYGYIYQALKPGYWCMSCRTAMAEATAESEYKSHKSLSVYVKFPLKDRKNEFVLVWTTTPWTLPANLAVALHPSVDYVFASVNGEKWLVAERLLDAIAQKTGAKFGAVARKALLAFAALRDADLREGGRGPLALHARLVAERRAQLLAPVPEHITHEAEERHLVERGERRGGTDAEGDDRGRDLRRRPERSRGNAPHDPRLCGALRPVLGNHLRPAGDRQRPGAQPQQDRPRPACRQPRHQDALAPGVGRCHTLHRSAGTRTGIQARTRTGTRTRV